MGQRDAERETGAGHQRDDLVRGLFGALAGMATETAKRLPSPGTWEAEMVGQGVDVDGRDHVRVSRALLELFRTTTSAFDARQRWDRAHREARADENGELGRIGAFDVATATVDLDGDPVDASVSTSPRRGPRAA